MSATIERGSATRITIEALVDADPKTVWHAWNSPEAIRQWNTPTAEWHTTRSSVDLREGGHFSSRMEAKDGSMGFDFAGTFTKVVPYRQIDYRLGDGREVTNEFIAEHEGVRVKVTFDAETENPLEQQRDGWQAILDSFARYAGHARGHAQ